MKREFLAYLEQFSLIDKELAIVDSNTLFFSSQKGLKYLFPKKKIKGYYWYVGNPAYKNLTFEYYYQNDHKYKIANVIELFMTAPTPPIKSIKNARPVFNDDIHHEEITRIIS